MKGKIADGYKEVNKNKIVNKKEWKGRLQERILDLGRGIDYKRPASS
jgi:hypothetical protein